MNAWKSFVVRGHVFGNMWIVDGFKAFENLERT